MIRWALLANTTVSPLVARLRSALHAAGAENAVWAVEYGEALQQILQPDSPLYVSQPDFVSLYFDLEQFKPNLAHTLAFAPPQDRQVGLDEVLVQISGFLKALRANCRATILINNFPVIPRTALGLGLDPIYRNSVRHLNLKLSDEVSQVSQCYLYDCDSLWAEAGWADRDRRFEMLAQFPFGPRMQQLLVAEWLRYFCAVQGRSRKCIVLDLDNTLWGGILGEDGPDKIQMGDTPHGRPYRRLQATLKALARRGVLLAVCSKNNPDEALEVLRSHPDILLREADFAAMRINWQDKATNLRELAAELNIGLQHFVFLDDNPAERKWVRDSHPDVLVPELPVDAAGYADVLTQCELDTLALTDEDLKRTQMYGEDRQRRQFQTQVGTFEQFLKDLQLVVHVERLNPSLLDRAAQLCQRTNQFNLTTRRHTAADLKQFDATPGKAVFVMNARDRFGEHGWTGVAAIERAGDRAEIESFLVSCRVLGKQAEFALFDVLVQWAREQGCAELAGRFIATAKNKPCTDFYPQCGLQPTSSDGLFAAALDTLPARPIEHLQLTVKW